MMGFKAGGGGGGRRIISRFRQVLVSNGGVIGSLKIKLLLSFCFLFTLFVFAGRVPSFMGWQHQVSTASASTPHRKGFTLLINTWKRDDLLKQSISHYASCADLDSIHIVWSEPNSPSDSLRNFLLHTIQSKSRYGREVKLKFDFNTEDSLNNRFKPIKDLRTDAIFSIDDDVLFPCTSVDFAFSVWQSASDTMVGFVPRIHWMDQLHKSSDERYAYGGWWSVWWMGTYSMVLSKAAFFHKKYLDIYTNQMPASIRDYITKNRFISLQIYSVAFSVISVLVLILHPSYFLNTRNCEDIAMSFLVANVSGAPPIWVKGKILDFGSSGISSLGGHTEKRSECVNRFVAEFGHMPLVSTSVKAVDSRKVWFW